MKQLKVLFLVSCLMMPLCIAATAHAAQQLSMDNVGVPCGVYGAGVNMPLTLVKDGQHIAGVSTDITFDASYLRCTGAITGPAATTATVRTEDISPGVVRVAVYNENLDELGDGIVAYVQFTLNKNPVGGTDVAGTCSASDPAGVNVPISCVSGGFFTAKTGDLDRDGTVDPTELGDVIGMFLGLTPVHPMADPNGNKVVEISEVIQAINCFLETASCNCPTATDAPPEAAEWALSAHADKNAMAFNDWNDCTPAIGNTTCNPAVPSSCAKCHNTSGYRDFIGADGTSALSMDNTKYITKITLTGNTKSTEIGYPIGEVITCNACHNQQASEMTSVTFPSGKVVSNLGAEARCMVCHQGRKSSQSVNDYLYGTAAGVAPAIIGKVTPTTANDTVFSMSFQNVHYMGAGATQYGMAAAGGYQYAGKLYDARFAHVEGTDTCITCHNPHSLEIRYDKCVTCHTGAVSAENLHDIRMKGSLVDYDGDGDSTEGVYYEIQGVQAKLLQSIQAYAIQKGTPIVYNPASNPYWFKADGTTKYDAFYTGRLMKACYNYQFSMKDKGAYAHGGKYVIELLYDSIEDLNVFLTSPVDLTGMSRGDEGHFNGATEIFRHWDSTGTVPKDCAKCHSAKGVQFFLANGLNLSEPAANGMLCANCHTVATDTTGTVRAAAMVIFPSLIPTAGVTLGDNSNICLLCHQGRESKVSVDAKITKGPISPATGFPVTNPHYFAAGATLFGTDVKGGYEYSGHTYVGKNTFPGHSGGGSPAKFVTCVECHMGTKGLDPANKSHNVTTPNKANCACHAFDSGQTGGSFEFSGIRKTPIDYDGDGNTAESLRSEIAGLEAALYAQIQTYATGTIGTGIEYVAGYPYFQKVGGGTYNKMDAALLKATYNYLITKKEPAGYIHNAKYIAQLLVDSIEDLGGTVPNSGLWR